MVLGGWKFAILITPRAPLLLLAGFTISPLIGHSYLPTYTLEAWGIYVHLLYNRGRRLSMYCGSSTNPNAGGVRTRLLESLKGRVLLKYVKQATCRWWLGDTGYTYNLGRKGILLSY